MAKPNILTRLVAGKLIDTFNGVVDTWNFFCDFVENLRGDGDGDKARGIVVDRSVPDRPVIRIKDDFASGGSASTSIKVIGTDDSEAIIGDPEAAEFKTLTFASAEDSNVIVSVAGTDGNVTVTVGVHYK